MKGTKAAPPAWPPLTKAHELAPVAVVVTATEVPAAIVPFAEAAGAVAPGVIVNAANGVIAKFDPEGQDEMKPAARVKTARMPRGVSKAEGIAACFEAVRMKV